MMWSQDNVLVLGPETGLKVAGAVGKKGGGVQSILSLLQDLIVFQEKVTNTIEIQDIGEYKQKLEAFHQRLGEMYTSLLDMAKSGVQAIKQQEAIQQESPLVDDSAIQQMP